MPTSKRLPPKTTGITFAFLLITFICVVAALVLSIVALFIASDAKDGSATTRFCFQMDGDSVRPGPGDADGLGFGTLTLNKDNCEIEWWLTVAKISKPYTALHIHGPLTGLNPEVADVHVFLNAECDDGKSGSSDHDDDDSDHSDHDGHGKGGHKREFCNVIRGHVREHCSKIHAILDKPVKYYINLHNGEFPDGALRANLGAVC